MTAELFMGAVCFFLVLGILVGAREESPVVERRSTRRSR